MKLRIWLVAGVLVLLSAALGIGYFLGDQQRSQPEPENQPSSAQKPEPTALEGYHEGIQKLWQKGPKESEEHFDKEITRTGDLRSFHGYALSLFTQEKYEEAEKNLQFILGHENEPNLHAASHYLLGLIRDATRDYDESIRYMERALEYYTRTNYT